MIPDREGADGLGVLGRMGWPGPAEAELCLLFSPLLFYEFSIKAPPESPPGDSGGATPDCIWRFGRTES